jgi:hypothetical protein
MRAHSIDNGFYDTEAFANNWWTEGGWASPLLAMNDARVPYFDRAFHHLGTRTSHTHTHTHTEREREIGRP